MTVDGLMAKLSGFPLSAQVKIRYSVDVRYSEWTRGTESRIGDLRDEAVLDVDGRVILAADLCECD